MSGNSTEPAPAPPSFTLFDVGGQTVPQYRALLVVKAFASVLSFTGSGLIVFMSYRKRKERFYHRLMCALSLCDMISSSAFLISAFAMPKETGYPGAVGSEQTCAAAGFIYQTFYSATSVLSATLSFSFVLMVRYNLRDLQVAKRTEKWTYLAAFCLAPIVPIIALTDEALAANPFVHQCAFIDFPPGCNNRGTDCIKGAWADELLTATNWLRGTMTSIAVASVIITYWTVRQIERRQLKYSFSNNLRRARAAGIRQRTLAAANGQAPTAEGQPVNDASQANPQPSVAPGNETEQDQSEQDQSERNQNSSRVETNQTDRNVQQSQPDEVTMRQHRTKNRRLLSRSFCYVLAYFNSIIWNAVSRWLALNADWFGRLDEPGWVTFSFLYTFFIPVQGFFNFLIYIRPIYTEMRKKFPDIFWIVLLYHAIKDNGTVLGRSSSTRLNSRQSSDDRT